MSNLLEIENISKTFGDNRVLKNISFNVPSGAIVGFIGDNGAGKSTTFKAVLGLISKDEGKVKMFGEEYINKNIETKEKIGVVFDEMNLPVYLTIKQINRILKNIYGHWDQKGFYRLIESFSLPINKKIKEFSRGMSMKLSVAVALSHDAKLLFLDEATGGLDPSSRELVLEELRNFASENDGGVLLSSHIMSDVEKIASHLVCIKNGEILLNDSKEYVLENYGIIDVFHSEFDLLNKDTIVAKKDYASYISVLVSDKWKFPRKTHNQNISIDELSIFLTRSE